MALKGPPSPLEHLFLNVVSVHVSKLYFIGATIMIYFLMIQCTTILNG